MQKRRILRKHFKKWTSSNSREANFLKAEYATISPNCPHTKFGGGPRSARPRVRSAKSSASSSARPTASQRLDALVRKTHQGNRVEDTADLRAQLEARLDSVLWKTGLTKSILEAKQAINHKRVRVNHTRVTLPGIHLYPGDIIQLMPSFQSHARVHPPPLHSSENTSERSSDAFAHADPLRGISRRDSRFIQNIGGSKSARLSEGLETRYAQTHIAEVDYATNTLIIVSEPYLASVLSTTHEGSSNDRR